MSSSRREVDMCEVQGEQNKDFIQTCMKMLTGMYGTHFNSSMRRRCQKIAEFDYSSSRYDEILSDLKFMRDKARDNAIEILKETPAKSSLWGVGASEKNENVYGDRLPWILAVYGSEGEGDKIGWRKYSGAMGEWLSLDTMCDFLSIDPRDSAIDNFLLRTKASRFMDSVTSFKWISDVIAMGYGAWCDQEDAAPVKLKKVLSEKNVEQLCDAIGKYAAPAGVLDRKFVRAMNEWNFNSPLVEELAFKRTRFTTFREFEKVFFGREPDEKPFVEIDGVPKLLNVGAAATGLCYAISDLLERTLRDGMGVNKGDPLEFAMCYSLQKVKAPQMKVSHTGYLMRDGSSQKDQVDLSLWQGSCCFVGEIKGYKSRGGVDGDMNRFTDIQEPVRQITTRLDHLLEGWRLNDRKFTQFSGAAIMAHDYSSGIWVKESVDMLGELDVNVFSAHSFILAVSLMYDVRDLIDYLSFRQKMKTDILVVDELEILLGYVQGFDAPEASEGDVRYIMNPFVVSWADRLRWKIPSGRCRDSWRRSFVDMARPDEFRLGGEWG